MPFLANKADSANNEEPLIAIIESFTAFRVTAHFVVLSDHNSTPTPISQHLEIVLVPHLNTVMDTAIDMSDASKALDLSNIRFQLM